MMTIVIAACALVVVALVSWGATVLLAEAELENLDSRDDLEAR